MDKDKHKLNCLRSSVFIRGLLKFMESIHWIKQALFGKTGRNILRM